MYLEPNTKIWLTINGNRFQIPVNPEKLDIGEAMSPDTFQILYKGQIQVPNTGTCGRSSGRLSSLSLTRPSCRTGREILGVMRTGLSRP